MSLGRFLEKFDGAPPGGTGRGAAEKPATAADVDAARAAGYEAGYASGWDDAVKAEETSRKHVDAELERNIRDLGFTYHEAVGAVRGELERFVDALVSAFLPAVLPDLTRAYLRESLMSLAEDRLDVPVELVVSPDSRGQLDDIAEAGFPFELTLVEDATLVPSQIFLRFGESEKAIDLAPLAETLCAQVRALSDPQDGVQEHG